MNVEFLAPAYGELTDAIEYYNEQSEGLGFEFAAEVQRRSSKSFNIPSLDATIQANSTLSNEPFPME